MEVNHDFTYTLFSYSCPLFASQKRFQDTAREFFYLSHIFYIDVLESFLHILSDAGVYFVPPKKMGTLSKVQNIAVFGTRTYKFYV